MEREVISSVADPASEQAGLLCSFLGCDRRPFNPLLATLPKMIHAPASDHDADTWIAQFVRLAVAESRDKRRGAKRYSSA